MRSSLRKGEREKPLPTPLSLVTAVLQLPADRKDAGDQAPVKPFWATPAAALLQELCSDPAGLTTTEAGRRLAIHGPNTVTEGRRRPGWLRLAGRLRNPLVLVLITASMLSAMTGDVASFVIVVTIVSISMVLDFAQESRAEDAIEALRHSVTVKATVRRDGKVISLAFPQLVPGDVVELIAGDLIPADARLLECRDLFVNQALLTGEPYPAEKHAGNELQASSNAADAINAVFSGTSVVSGTATAVICQTGARYGPR